MEMEARARELVRAYRKRKGLAWMILAVGIVYLFYIVFRVLEGPAAEELGGLAMTALLFSAYVVFALFAVAAVLVKQSGGMILNRVYQEQCDPALYEACLLKLHFFLQPGWKACNLAIAQYQQGDYGRAQDTLASVPVQKLRKNLIPGYYQCLCALCFKQGRGGEVAALEEACRLALGPKNPGGSSSLPWCVPTTTCSGRWRTGIMKRHSFSCRPPGGPGQVLSPGRWLRSPTACGWPGSVWDWGRKGAPVCIWPM